MFDRCCMADARQTAKGTDIMSARRTCAVRASSEADTIATPRKAGNPSKKFSRVSPSWTERQDIESASDTALNPANYQGRHPGEAHLFDAARSHTGHELAALTIKVAAADGWDDIILREDALKQLSEICRRVTLRRDAMGKRGFARKLSRSEGVNALFHDHSGAGQTVPAKVIARSPLDFDSNSYLGQSPELIFSSNT
jgi:hypothetical protein